MPSAHPKRDVFTCLTMDMFILPSASLIARKAFEAVGGFDENLMGYEDDDLFLRLFGLGSLDDLPELSAFDPSPELEAELRERLLQAGEARAAG